MVIPCYVGISASKLKCWVSNHQSQILWRKTIVFIRRRPKINIFLQLGERASRKSSSAVRILSDFRSRSCRAMWTSTQSGQCHHVCHWRLSDGIRLFAQWSNFAGSLEDYPIAQNIQTLLSAVILGPGTRVRGPATFGPEIMRNELKSWPRDQIFTATVLWAEERYSFSVFSWWKL